jgi:hypothetical protein
MVQVMRSSFLALAGLILLLPACSGLRNLERNQQSTRVAADSTVHLEAVQSIQQEKVLETLTLERDSLNSHYSVQIWPKGKFSYSAAHGFEGSAEKIMISGAVKQGKQSLSSALRKETKTQWQKTSSDLQKRSSSVTQRLVKKKSVSWKTILGYALILFSVIALLLFFRALRIRLRLAGV